MVLNIKKRYFIQLMVATVSLVATVEECVFISVRDVVYYFIMRKVYSHINVQEVQQLVLYSREI